MSNKTENRFIRTRELLSRRDLRKKITGILLILLVAFLLYPKIAPIQNIITISGDDSIEPDKVPVQAYVAKSQAIRDAISTTGTIQAKNNINLSAETSGLVTSIYFEEGMGVSEGDLLVKINDAELQAQLDRESFSLELMRETEERQRQLFEGGGVSQEEYDATKNQLNIHESEVALIQAQIDKTEIRAPFDGIIGLKYIHEGSYIDSSTRIATLQNMSIMNIDFSVPERYAPRVHRGNEVEFFIQGVDSVFTGEVYAIEPQIDSRTRTLQVRARAENDQELLRPGSFAEIRLILDSHDESIMIPAIALIPHGQNHKVLVYRSGEIEEVQVITGTRTSNLVQISDGLAPGDTVLTSGLLQVQQGSLVEITRIDTTSQQKVSSR